MEFRRTRQKFDGATPEWNTAPPESLGGIEKLERCEKELHGDHAKRDRDDDKWHWSEKKLHGDHVKRDRDDDQ